MNDEPTTCSNANWADKLQLSVLRTELSDLEWVPEEWLKYLVVTDLIRGMLKVMSGGGIVILCDHKTWDRLENEINWIRTRVGSLFGVEVYESDQLAKAVLKEYFEVD